MPPTALQSLNSCLATGRFGQAAFNKELLVAVGILLDESVATHCARKLKSLEFLRQTCSRSDT
jgi:hypothetical protein